MYEKTIDNKEIALGVYGKRKDKEAALRKANEGRDEKDWMGQSLYNPAARQKNTVGRR